MSDGRGRHGNHRKGSEHPRWSDERKIASNGYAQIRVGKGHPLADRNGYAYEHHVVWVSAQCSLVPSGFVVHHLNGNKLDNRIENLECISRARHNEIHNAERARGEDGRLL